MERLGEDSIGFVSFLESAGVLPPAMREMVIDRATAIPGGPVDLEDLKIIVRPSGSVEFWADNLASAAKTDIQAYIPTGANYAQLTHYENGDALQLTPHVSSTSRLIVTGIFFTAP